MKLLVQLLSNVACGLFSARKTRELVQQILLKKTDSLPAKEALELLLDLDIFLYKRSGKIGQRYEKSGTHPKHRLAPYQTFFNRNLSPDDVVLDVGCSFGMLAKAMAEGSGARVIGVELVAERIEDAKRDNAHPNVSYFAGDAKLFETPEPITAIVMSNVWEHIEDRPDFLRTLMARYRPAKCLIRVPFFDRDWRNPMRKELGLNCYLDSTHYIEHTEAEFRADVAEAGLDIVSMYVQWNEIYAVCHPKG